MLYSICYVTYFISYIAYIKTKAIYYRFFYCVTMYIFYNKLVLSCLWLAGRGGAGKEAQQLPSIRSHSGFTCFLLMCLAGPLAHLV